MKICAHCQEEIMPSERIRFADGKMHRECLLRNVAGSVGHQLRQCSCFGGKGTGDFANLTVRKNARLAEWFFRSRTKAAAAKAKFN